MMPTVDRWLLPDGIEEVLPEEAARTEAARRQLLDLFSRWGYDLVITPHIEYLESLLTGSGHDLDLQTFKMTDRLSGRMLRSEEHTSELQSRPHLVCRLLLEKKKKTKVTSSF